MGLAPAPSLPARTRRWRRVKVVIEGCGGSQCRTTTEEMGNGRETTGAPRSNTDRDADSQSNPGTRFAFSGIIPHSDLSSNSPSWPRATTGASSRDSSSAARIENRPSATRAENSAMPPLVGSTTPSAEANDRMEAKSVNDGSPTATSPSRNVRSSPSLSVLATGWEVDRRVAITIRTSPVDAVASPATTSTSSPTVPVSMGGLGAGSLSGQVQGGSCVEADFDQSTNSPPK